VFDEFEVVLLVGVDDRLCVAIGCELVTLQFEFTAKSSKVVDFSVIDGPNRTVFVPHRLVTPRYVDYAQSANTQRPIRVLDVSAVIRATMG